MGALLPLKRFIARALLSDFLFEKLVRRLVRDEFISTSAGHIDVRDQSTFVKSLLFWRIYERSEANMIRRFLPTNIPVVELGASIGFTTAVICSRMGIGVPVVAVEANPRLIPNLRSTKARNGFQSLTILSAAVDYSGAKDIQFILDDRNLGSHKGGGSTSISVPPIRLSEIVREYKFSEYSLVCDIEGAEIEMFLRERDESTINACKCIIIELHEAKFDERTYTPHDAAAIVSDSFGMRLVHFDAKTWVFGR